MKSIYWFRRDLRLHDNRGLAKAYRESERVAPVYVLDKELFESMESNAPYMSFLINALRKLKESINISLFIGSTGEVFETILSKYAFDAVYTATPLSPNERSVADAVREVCRRLGVKYIEILDNVLTNSLQNHPLNNFSAFYRSWLRSLDTSITPTVANKKFMSIDALELNEALSKIGLNKVDLEHLTIEWGFNRMNSFKFSEYDKLRNYPCVDGVSRLSHFINLGVLSIREIYLRAVKESKEYIRQLAWREYYIALSNRNPWIERLELKEYMRGFEWENNRYYVERFIRGETGYPIVDAGIKQLMKEGWIHNRVRLVVANFLVKDLHIDWREGLRFFKSKLLDYDEAINAGNWQWAASVGVDPLPLRVFNPVRQAERFDPTCEYIKRYIPELRNTDCSALQDPLTHRIKGYYEPIVDHYEAVEKFRDKVRMRISEWRTRRI